MLAEPIVGRASVTDGDTVTIRGTRIRLYGIDAPESAQLCHEAAGKAYRCGQIAALALADRIGEAPISCEPRDTDRYGRRDAIMKPAEIVIVTKDRRRHRAEVPYGAPNTGAIK